MPGLKCGLFKWKNAKIKTWNVHDNMYESLYVLKE